MEYQYFSPMIRLPASDAALSACSAISAPSFPSSSKVPASTLGRFLCAFGPNVSEKGSVSTIWGRCAVYSARALGDISNALFTFCRLGFAASSSSAMGSLFLFSKTEYGSSFFPPRLVLKWSNAVCEMTLVFPAKSNNFSRLNLSTRNSR